MIFGSLINALAIAALCCCPPEHWEGYLSMISSIDRNTKSQDDYYKEIVKVTTQMHL